MARHRDRYGIAQARNMDTIWIQKRTRSNLDKPTVQSQTRKAHKVSWERKWGTKMLGFTATHPYTQMEL